MMRTARSAPPATLLLPNGGVILALDDHLDPAHLGQCKYFEFCRLIWRNCIFQKRLGTFSRVACVGCVCV